MPALKTEIKLFSFKKISYCFKGLFLAHLFSVKMRVGFDPRPATLLNTKPFSPEPEKFFELLTISLTFNERKKNAREKH